MTKVLFVCLGNICRSPLGEAIFNHKVKGLSMEADSAGTAAYHVGENPDHRSIEVARAHGVPISHKARKFVAEDFDRFDYILAMDRNNFRDMKALAAGSAKNLYLLRGFDPEADGDLDVPDPYYGGYDGFENVFQMVSRSVDQLIAHIETQK
ncbi:low molecular weight phosphotyrosine protein phosphatase [Reichenbachiella carrageenanivorans]|uniref:protein-tyrosine-phosphatase n=1 Tax=Reichenbachiella carrageenanivorans TaxID=2979869 RepID=A0ABY6D4Q2_9BACT|nr:low molecular weight protein-tyrosine-phosphatase [Reichenbachiella carrageenanivorans]UXX80038.1 low molecular weight phosphotyrosine protein phosphatase [Reichenbachiella carrageenanivorans]